ncbi:MAG: ubiquitin carboxyl-terminal hydrolase, partial [Myxococcales bacterium]|nr:ubiquitin carboxyl-terminal hydrolase [Myxococcales bacterium]
FIQDGKCERCHEMGIVRSSNMKSLPKALMILLKRFNRIDGSEERLDAKVCPQEELNISYENGDKKYKLCGVILHHPGRENSIQFGHYTAYTKNNAGQWHHYNDAICNEITIEKVTSASAEPYVCFYREDN